MPSGNLIGTEQVGSSSGKFFQPDLDPRGIDEYLLGTARQLNAAWTGRATARYRYGYNFWEDTNNNARIAFNAAGGHRRASSTSRTSPPYQREIGGSSYVIAELDGAFTKYYEAEPRGRAAGQASRSCAAPTPGATTTATSTRTTPTTDNDAVDLHRLVVHRRRRRPAALGLPLRRPARRPPAPAQGSTATTSCPGTRNAGAFAVYQSGQPWEVWDVERYRALTTSTSDANRFAEPAGSRETDAHYQIDLNYTQDIPVGGRFNVQLRADVFNVSDNQTGYSIQNQTHSAGFGQPRLAFDPRRLQLAVRLEF